MTIHSTGRTMQPIVSSRVGAPDPLVPTIFHEDWWLNAATRGEIEYAEVSEGGRVVGRMPYVLSLRYGVTSSNMPTLTHFLGPAIDAGKGSEANRFVKRQAITHDLIKRLPKISAFRQKLHAGIADALPFQAAGFQVTTQFTFELAASPETTIWTSMRDKTRNVIRRAEENLRVDMPMDPEEYIAVSRSHLAARGAQPNVAFDLCLDLMGQAIARHQACIWTASDSHGTVKAAICCVWDQARLYYLMSTRAADSGNGAIALLIWRAIQAATRMGLIFDFDGIGSAGSVLFYSGFGGKVAPRYIIGRSTMPYRILRQIRRLSPDAANPFT